MIRQKTFYEYTDSAKSHDENVQNFLDKISEEGHMFISLNTIAYGHNGHLNRLRTEIVYQENYTRKVITEKI